MKWRQFLQNGLRDVILMGFGAWIIWKQVYAVNPNQFLDVIGFAMMVPSARSAIIKILSEPGSSSESSDPPEEPPSHSSSRKGTHDRSSEKEDGASEEDGSGRSLFLRGTGNYVPVDWCRFVLLY